MRASHKHSERTRGKAGKLARVAYAVGRGGKKALASIMGRASTGGAVAAKTAKRTNRSDSDILRSRGAEQEVLDMIDAPVAG